MRNGNVYLLILISCSLLLGAASCDQHKPPVVERCILGDEGCVCIDRRIDDEPYIIPYEECKNYIATNPSDYGALKKWHDSKIKALIKCQRRQ